MIALLAQPGSGYAAAAKAFPSAEGFGTQTRGAYGGATNPTIYKVTNLTDPATRTPTFDGSFRWAVEAPEPRVIIFGVAGYLLINKELQVNNPYLTIAGQTAPGGGICLRNAPTWGMRTMLIATHDVIVRHLRFRPGKANPGVGVDSNQAIQMGFYPAPETYNVVLDHCSATWGIDGNIQGATLAHDTTIQWSIISEGLNNAGHTGGLHSRALNFYVGNSASDQAINGRNSVHHNLLSHVQFRVPQISTVLGLVEVINNVVYHTTQQGMNVNAGAHDSVSDSKTRFIKNYLLRTNPAFNDVKIAPGHLPTVLVHAMGNIGPARPNDTLPQDQTLDTTPTSTCSVCNLTSPANQRNHWTVDPLCTDQTGTFPQPGNLVAEDTAAVTLAKLSGTGAYAGQQNVGATKPQRDAVDTRILNNLTTYIANPEATNTVPVPGGPNDGLLDDPAQVGGYPALAPGTPVDDSDGDGISDAWEISHGLNPNNAADGQLVAANGYRNLENYINELAGDSIPAGSATVTFTSVAAEDGHVLESTANSNVGGTVASTNALFTTGDSAANQQYKGFLSFDTSSLPDTGITIVSATLRLKRDSVAGTNPFGTHGELRVDIRKGGFSGNVALESADFQAAPSATNVAQIGDPGANGAFSTGGGLNASGLAQINRTGRTQMRVYFVTSDNGDSGADFVKWMSGSAATGSKPELVIVY